jgi:hypothetical protein
VISNRHAMPNNGFKALKQMDLFDPPGMSQTRHWRNTYVPSYTMNDTKKQPGTGKGAG